MLEPTNETLKITPELLAAAHLIMKSFEETLTAEEQSVVAGQKMSDLVKLFIECEYAAQWRLRTTKAAAQAA